MFLCLLFITAAWEGDWPLHLEYDTTFLYSRSCELCKVGFVLSTNHGSTARQCPIPLHEKGAHTIHLSAIFLPLHGQEYGQNMWTEVSYSQIGKGPAGIIIGQSTNMETVTVWAYSLNACCEVVGCLDAMLDKSSTDNMRKEEKNPEFHMITLFYKIFCVKN